jgi:adenylate cyclase
MTKEYPVTVKSFHNKSTDYPSFYLCKSINMRYRINQFVLDTDRFELSENSAQIQVEPQVIELLVLLIENRNRMVSKEEINEKVWKGRVVSEATLSSRIKIARRVLGDDGRRQQFIRTIHKKGFSFVASVELEQTGPNQNSDLAVSKMRDKPLENGGPGVRPEQPSIAVLPFTNLSNDPEQEYFSDGITEDIIIELSRVSILTVSARHSSFSFKGKTLDIRDIGVQLNVQYILEGSVRRQGNQIRITVQLIDAETGKQIWAERYDRAMQDLFAVQDDVTRKITAVLPGRLHNDVAERASRIPTDNMKAYDLMLQGNQFRNRFNVEDNVRARQLFERAVELDPRYCRALGFLADTYFVDFMLGLCSEDTANLILDLSRRAASYDPTDINVQDMLGFAYACAGMWEDAEVQFDKTIEAISNQADAMVWCGYGLLLLGRHEDALNLIREALKLDPFHPKSHDWVMGQACYMEKLYEETCRLFNDETLLNSIGYACLTGAHAHLGQKDKANSALERFIIARQSELESKEIPCETISIEALAGGYRQSWRRQLDWEHIAQGLRLAGLPN